MARLFGFQGRMSLIFPDTWIANIDLVQFGVGDGTQYIDFRPNGGPVLALRMHIAKPGPGAYDSAVTRQLPQVDRLDAAAAAAVVWDGATIFLEPYAHALTFGVSAQTIDLRPPPPASGPLQFPPDMVGGYPVDTAIPIHYVLYDTGYGSGEYALVRRPDGSTLQSADRPSASHQRQPGTPHNLAALSWHARDRPFHKVVAEERASTDRPWGWMQWEGCTLQELLETEARWFPDTDNDYLAIDPEIWSAALIVQRMCQLYIPAGAALAGTYIRCGVAYGNYRVPQNLSILIGVARDQGELISVTSDVVTDCSGETYRHAQQTIVDRLRTITEHRRSMLGGSEAI